MEIEDLGLNGPKLIKLKSFGDDRGFFVERFKRQAFQEAGLPFEFVQDNFSTSVPKVLRGLHYQFELPQGKLVTVTRGSILDVAVDIRSSSKTFGKHVSAVLESAHPTWIWVPAGFAHGFVVLGDESADVLYKVDNPYNSKGESGLRFNDSDLAIEWPVSHVLTSPKDSVLPTFKDYCRNPKF